MKEPSLYSCPDLFCCQGWGVSWLSLKELLRIPTRIKLILKSWSSPESVEMLHQCPKDACSSAWRVTTAHLWFKRLLGSWSVWFETELVLLRWGPVKPLVGKWCVRLWVEKAGNQKRPAGEVWPFQLVWSWMNLESQASWTSVSPLSDGMDVSLSTLISHCETVMRKHMWRGNRKPAVYSAKEDAQGSPVWFEIVSVFLTVYINMRCFTTQFIEIDWIQL